jgi:hypothetical protein
VPFLLITVYLCLAGDRPFTMQLEFVPVEEFYFALTLAVRTLEDIAQPDVATQVKIALAEKFGQPSTIAAASQNTYNYVFCVTDVDNSPAPQLMLSIADWQGNLRLGSDYGWMLDAERKPVRTEKFAQRGAFTQQVIAYLETWLGVTLPAV